MAERKAITDCQADDTKLADRPLLLPANRDQTASVTYPQPSQPSDAYPPTPPAKNNRTLLIVLGAIGGVLVLLCAGCIIVGLIVGDDEAKRVSQEATTTTPVAATPPAPTPEATPPVTETTPPPTTPSESPAVKMPNLVGENAAIAEDQLRKLGFTEIQFGSQDEFDTLVIIRANWTVTKQSTKAGKTIPLDTLIVLTCTKQK